MKHQSLCTALILSIALGTMNSQLQGQSSTERGAVRGGVAGAILGGLAGNRDGNTAKGVAIGTLVGALAGGAIGNAEGAERQRQYQYQAYRQQLQQRHQAQLQQAVSLSDAITMSRSGISDSLIINQVRTTGVEQRIGVQEIVFLHQNGVSESVIQAMQSAPVGVAVNASPFQSQAYHYPAPRQQTIVVEHAPRVIVQPYVVPPPRPRYYPPHYHGPTASFEWRVRR